MDKNSKMQFFILSDVYQVAYQLLASSGRTARVARRSFGRHSYRTRSPRLLVPALCLLGLAGAMLLMPGCQSHTSGSRPVWAEVDGHPIYQGRVDRIYRSRIASGGEANDKEEELSYKLNILNQLINNQILLAHASHSGITVPESEVDTKVAQLGSPYSKEQFAEKLKERGMTESDLRDEIRTTLTLNKLINRDVNARVSVSDADIAAYYNRNKASFDVPETEYHLAQIEVTPMPTKDLHNLKNDDAKTPQMAQRKIQALYAQLRSGQDFATVAENYSEDPATASSGGDMGFVPESALASNPTIERVVKSLKVGQISGIITTPSGYHIIKLLGIEQAGQRSLSDAKVQSRIRETLMNEKEQLLKAAYIENLRDHAKVQNLLAEQIVKQAH